jgi:hypothetical protein
MARALGLLCALASWTVASCTPSSASKQRESAESSGEEAGDGAARKGMATRRLTRTQYDRAVRDLVLTSLPGAEGEAVLQEVSSWLASVPIDTVSPDAPFASMDRTISQEHVSTYFRVGEAVAGAMTANQARSMAVLACTAGADDEACIHAFIERFARRAFRSPATPEELAVLRDTYSFRTLEAEGVRNVITLVLNSPRFLYELALDADGAPRALNGYELAGKLALLFWQTLPDDRLLDAAARGELDQAAGYERAVDQVLADPRADAGLGVFVREWLDLEALRNLDTLAGDPLFRAFAGPNVPSAALRGEMIREVVDSFSYHFDRDDSYAAWFESPYSFALTPELAGLYGTAAWNGQGEPPRFRPGERAGLITRAALLATGTANTRPIMKGVFLRKRVLCDHLDPPLTSQANSPPQLSPTLTTREVVEALTEQEGTACASCHKYQINPLGFVTESYDALGRFRSEQVLLSPTGDVLGKKPVHTEGVPRIEVSDTRAVHSASELSARMLENGKAQECFARQFMRFALGREPATRHDDEARAALTQALRNKRGMRSVLRSYALSDTFKTRLPESAP